MKTLFVSFLLVATQAFAAADNYAIDASHTQVGFDIQHLMISKVRGRFNDFSGNFKFDDVKRELTGIEVTIHTKSVDTNEKKRDGHLMSPDFFDVEKYPTMTFKSDKTVSLASKNAKVPGNLTIHGVTKPVILDVDYTGSATDPQGNFRIAFSARTSVNRKDFGLKWNKTMDKGGAVVGDDVNIQIEGEAVKATPTIKK